MKTKHTKRTLKASYTLKLRYILKIYHTAERMPVISPQSHMYFFFFYIIYALITKWIRIRYLKFLMIFTNHFNFPVNFLIGFVQFFKFYVGQFLRSNPKAYLYRAFLKIYKMNILFGIFELQKIVPNDDLRIWMVVYYSL